MFSAQPVDSQEATAHLGHLLRVEEGPIERMEPYGHLTKDELLKHLSEDSFTSMKAFV